MIKETIAAIATGMTNAGIGIVRISGEESIAIIDKIYKSKSNNKKISNQKSHTIHYGYIYDGDILVDEVLVMLMCGPNSYTGEDTIEINCHGGSLVLRKVLETVLKNGARIAEPGEFTKRAFLNGKMDLTQAEAVIDVIESKNDYALKSSVNQLKGSFLNIIKELRERIIYEIAFIESALDDPEHISLEGYEDKLIEIIEEVEKDLTELVNTADSGRIIKEGIKTAIVGKPNAGKSSLLNVLIGEERAIVTDIAGTTRDILEETVNLSGVQLNIIDTAGIRETEDKVEKIGVKKAIENLEAADLVIFVVDSSIDLDESDRDIAERIRDKKGIVLLNKTDIDGVTTINMLKEITDKYIIPISAKEETGIKDLENKIKEMFYEGKISFNDQVLITNIRHKNGILDAIESLKLVRESILNGMPEDFYSIDLMSAYESLGNIIGESVEEDLVNEIFSKFCMGK